MQVRRFLAKDDSQLLLCRNYELGALVLHILLP